MPKRIRTRPWRHGKAHRSPAPLHARRARDRLSSAGQRGRRRGDQGFDPRQAHARFRQEPDRGEQPRLVRRGGAHRARPHRLPLGGIEAPHARGEPQARLLPLARVPDRPAARRGAEQPRADRAVQRRARRPRRRRASRCSPPSRTRRSAMAASAASPPASWKAWRRWQSRRSATASATTTASSARSSRTASSTNIRRTGSPSAIPGSSSGRRPSTTSASAASSRRRTLSGGGARAVWHPGETVQAVAYDTPIVGWKGRHVNPLRLWSARAVDPLRLDVFNAGDHVARADRAGARRDDLENPLSERRDAGRPGTARSGRNTSSSPPRCRISSSAISASTATSARCPTRRRFS